MSSVETAKKFKDYELSLGGHALSISSDKDPDKINQIVKLANEKIGSSLGRDYSFQKSLMIALLQVCEEVVDYKLQLCKKVEAIEEKSEQIRLKFQKLVEQA